MAKMQAGLILGWKAIEGFTGLSKNTIRKLYRENGFPLRRIAHGGMVCVDPCEVSEWQKKRLTNFDQF